MIKIAHARGQSFSREHQVEVSDFCGNFSSILRPNKNIEKMCAFARRLCECNNVLYDQGQRLTLYRELLANNYDTSKLDVCYCDCSSFIAAVLRYGGYDVPSYMTTATAINDCVSQGLMHIQYDKSQIQNGDILLYRNVELGKGHIVMVVDIDAKIKYPRVMKVNIASGYLNVRKEPSTNAPVTGTLHKGDAVIVSTICNGWATIDCDNVTAYVSSKYLI